MNTLSIQQPWGTLICCGLKDIENRRWAIKRTPLRVLIHVGAKRQPFTDDDMPLAWWLPIENYQKMGILGSMEQFPTSAIIGVATIDRCDTDSDSIWAQEYSPFKWVVKDAHLFAQPITNVKGRLGIYETPEINEANLPKFAEIPHIEINGTEAVLPLCRQEFDRINNGEADFVELNYTDDISKLFTNDKGELVELTTITFVCGNDRTEALEVSRVGVEPVKDKRGRQIKYEDDNGHSFKWSTLKIWLE